ncbi:MAG: hypothetical protein MUF18_02640 [Fimbriiglobus sp.]|jgi:hypothetical protein|nr:hypothetical protein [Fimbriiglobus sp.]
MTHPKLRLAAAKFALDLTTVDDMVNAAHTALDDAFYADGLAAIVSVPNLHLWDAAPHFTAALRELGQTFTSQDEALRFLRLGCFGAVAEGVINPHDGLGQH